MDQNMTRYSTWNLIKMITNKTKNQINYNFSIEIGYQNSIAKPSLPYVIYYVHC